MPRLPSRFIESALASRSEFEASLSLPAEQRAALEKEARKRLGPRRPSAEAVIEELQRAQRALIEALQDEFDCDELKPPVALGWDLAALKKFYASRGENLGTSDVACSITPEEFEPPPAPPAPPAPETYDEGCQTDDVPDVRVNLQRSSGCLEPGALPSDYKTTGGGFDLDAMRKDLETILGRHEDQGGLPSAFGLDDEISFLADDLSGVVPLGRLDGLLPPAHRRPQRRNETERVSSTPEYSPPGRLPPSAEPLLPALLGPQVAAPVFDADLDALVLGFSSPAVR
jgi:hypothetical protein